MKPSSLSGVKVVDCTHVIAGAYCSLLLADLGADVVKIEPVGGEQNREGIATPFRGFDFMNRNKRAIALDLAQSQAVEVARRLVETADVFVENFRPGALERMGLGYDDLRAINPRLIYCSISGFGHSGPYRERGGFDLIAQAMSGIMSFTGEIGADRPVAAGVPLSDLAAGCYGALAVLAALNHRHATGVGQKVEATLLESALSYAVWESGLYTTTGEIAVPRGSRHRLSAPYEALRTGDGYIVVGAANEGLWKKFCRGIGMPDLATQAAFATRPDRVTNRDRLQAILEEVLAGNTTAYWLDRLLAEGVPAGPINNIAQAVEDPHIKDRGLFVQIDGRRFIRAPLNMSESPVALMRGLPGVGQHTVEVLREAGLDDAEIARLADEGAVGLSAGHA